MTVRLTLDELAARGIRPGAACADMRRRWPFRYGVVLDVPGPDLIGVRWADGEYEQVSEAQIGMTGYVLSSKDLARLKYGKPSLPATAGSR